MKLKEWLTANSVSLRDFAEMIGVKQHTTVYRYIDVKKRRVPDPDVVVRIFHATKGAVTPEDFYDLKAAPKKRRTATT